MTLKHINCYKNLNPWNHESVIRKDIWKDFKGPFLRYLADKPDGDNIADRSCAKIMSTLIKKRNWTSPEKGRNIVTSKSPKKLFPTKLLRITHFFLSALSSATSEPRSQIASTPPTKSLRYKRIIRTAVKIIQKSYQMLQ